MDPLKKLANDFKKIKNPTLQEMKAFNDMFDATLASLQAANKTTAGPPPVRDDDDALARVMAESLASYREDEDLRRAMTNSRHDSGWGGGWRLGGAPGSSAERAALDGKAMQEQTGRLPKLPAGAASSAPRATEDPDLQASIALSLKSWEEQVAKEEQELQAEWRLNQATNAGIRAPQAALQSGFDNVGKLVLIGGFNSTYESKEAVIVEYDGYENKYLVRMTTTPAGTDGKLWVDPGQLFQKLTLF
jgi:hypothetical protein